MVIGNSYGWATRTTGYELEYPVVVATMAGLVAGSHSTTSTVGEESIGVSQGQAGTCMEGWNVGMHGQDQDTLRVGDGRQVV
ncbi:hypothetical protein Dimus_032572 [Dionaea muscipula]